MACIIGINSIINLNAITHRSFNSYLLLYFLVSKQSRLRLELNPLLVLIIQLLLSTVPVIEFDEEDPRANQILLLSLDFRPNVSRKSNVASSLTLWLFLF